MVENVLILAGGSGTRLWPVSSSALPKQYIQVDAGNVTGSLLYLTLERAAALQPRRIMIITLKEQAALAGKELDVWRKTTGHKIPELIVLGEPSGRNTAPAITAGIVWIALQGGGKENNLVLPSDHLVTPQQSFAGDVEKAAKLAAAGNLVTFGITPDRPETGYGYIKSGTVLDGGCKVERFLEKPDALSAQKFMDDGGYYWNSGMFMLNTDVYLSELKQHAPEVSAAFEAMYALSAEDLQYQDEALVWVLDSAAAGRIYEAAPAISIDYALMEKTTRAAMVPASFQWNDVGSWDEYSRLFQSKKSDSWAVQAKGNFVLSDIPVALVGVEDLIVTISNGKALICKKGASQQVKEVINELKESGREDLL